MKMKKSMLLTLVFGMLVFIDKTNARPDRRISSLSTDEDLDSESDFADFEPHRKHFGSGRRTRHSRQIYPDYPCSYHQTLEYKLDQIKLQLKLIMELLSSRQTANPVVVPYPYPIPFGIGSYLNNTSPIELGNRLGEVWGIIPGDGNDEDDQSIRPISLKPSKTPIPSGVRAPPVEHGSIQADKYPTTEKPIFTTEKPKKEPRVPTRCEAAILNCCRFDLEAEKEKCFTELKCTNTYKTGKACLPEVINFVIKVFTEAYKPR